jgi:hypothetical protein
MADSKQLSGRYGVPEALIKTRQLKKNHPHVCIGACNRGGGAVQKPKAFAAGDWRLEAAIEDKKSGTDKVSDPQNPRPLSATASYLEMSRLAVLDI